MRLSHLLIEYYVYLCYNVINKLTEALVNNMTEMEKYLMEQNKQLMKNVDQLTSQNKLLLEKIDQLTEQIAIMNQRFYGRRSEKMIPENQKSLFDDHLTPEESTLLAKIEAESTPVKKAKKRNS